MCIAHLQHAKLQKTGLMSTFDTLCNGQLPKSLNMILQHTTAATQNYFLQPLPGSMAAALFDITA